MRFQTTAAPSAPHNAIITSPSGAAVRDFLKAASNRWRGAEIMVIPAQVQGDGAATTIARAVKLAHKLRPVPDVLILSLETIIVSLQDWDTNSHWH